jgi:tetratricopeptide (TPR) repeat protein
MEHAIDLDPYNASLHDRLAIQLASALVNRPDEALAEIGRLASLQPTNPRANFHRWSILEQRGQYNDAIRQAMEYFTMEKRPAVAAALEEALAGGDYRRSVVRAAEIMASDRSLNPRDFLLISQLYAAAAADEQAIDWLYKAYESRQGNLPYVNAWPRFEHMRSNPRFRELLRRMNLLPAERP